MKMIPWLTLLSLVFTFGCAKKAENQVNVTFSQGLLFGGAALADFSQGGLMLWGSSVEGQRFAHVLRNADQLNLTLPNGQWSFYAMTWQNLSNIELDASGKLRCASTFSGLNGGDSQIDLTLAEANCAQNIFSGNLGAQISVMQFRKFICENITGATSTSNCASDRANPNRLSDPVTPLSVRVRLVEYSTLPGLNVGQGLSQCVNFDAITGSTNITAAGSLIFPLGNNPLLRVEFDYHLNSANCADTGANVLTHTNASLSPRFEANDTTLGIVNSFKQITDAQLCDQGRQNLTGFAGGNGSDQHPYIICSADQLYHLSENWATYAANSFRLANSIDLLPFINANIPQNIYLPSDHPCWSEGSNWRPLGWSYDGICNKTTAIEFSGSFDGNNHSLINLRAEHDGETHVGLFSHWAPSNENKFIRDLTFIQPSIEGGEYVGVLVGQKMPPNSVYIRNVHVVDGYLEAEGGGAGVNSFIGGIIGAGDWLGLVNVSTKNTDIVHAKDYAGGVFGSLMDALAVSAVFSSGTIINRGSDAMSSYVGGIGGFLDGGSIGQLSLLSHEGAIIGFSDNVGGLFGATSSLGAAPLAHAYATTSITNYAKTAGVLPGGIGGLIGYIGGPLDINATYFAGHILSSCTGAGCPVGLVFGRRSASAVNGNVYVYETPSRTIAAPGDDGITKTIVNNSTTSPSLYIPADSPNLLETQFIKTQNALPRLVQQQHPCVLEPLNTGFYNRQNLTTQMSLGYGTNPNSPLVICHKEQFEQITSLPSSPQIYVELIAPINLAGSYTPVHIKSNIVLDGYKGLLYGFDQTTTALAVNETRAPIAINDGEIYDLSVAGINLGAPSSVGSNTLSSFVHTNSGLIHNSHVMSAVLTSTNVDTNLSGFVAENQLNSFILQSSSQTHFSNSQAAASGFAHFNFGTIADITSAPLFEMTAATSLTSNTSGIFYQNDGAVDKAELRGRISNDSNVVVQNLWGFGKINNGLITDSLIHYSTYLSTNLSNGNFATVVENNNTGATITRVINEGTFLNQNNLSETYTAGDAQSVKTNNGSLYGIFSTRPAGRQIAAGTGSVNFYCSGINVIIDPTMYALSGPLSTIAGIEAQPQTWLETRNSNGDFTLHKVTTLSNNGTSIIAAIEDGLCPPQFNDANINVSFIQSYASIDSEARGDVTDPLGIFVGIIEPQLLDQSYFATGPWAGEFLDPFNSLADYDLIVDAFLDISIFGTTDIILPPWEFDERIAPENNSMRLLRYD